MEFLDMATRRQLGFDQVWSQITPVSSLGKVLMRQAHAFTQAEWPELEREFNRLEQIRDQLTREPKSADNLIFLLSAVRDISGSLKRSMQGVTLDDMEFYEIKKLLGTGEKVVLELERLGWLSLLSKPLDLCAECRESLSRGQGGHDSFYVADAYDQKLARVRAERARLERIRAGFRASVDSALIQTVGRFLSMEGEITVGAGDAETIALLEAMIELHKTQESANFVTFQLNEDEEMRQIRETLVEVRVEEEQCKEEVRVELTALVGEFAPRIGDLLESLAWLDFLLAKGKFAAAMGGVKPQVSKASRICIHDGRHLILEEEVAQGGQIYTPLTLEASPGVTLITGPNMGGKTATLKTLGLLTAMAQYGLLVPASSMEFSPRLFIRAHLAASEIPRGLSAFAGEVVFLRDVVQQSGGGEDGLVLVDEIAHGTNPVEGAGIAQAIIEYLRGQQAITVITTHFPSLVGLSSIRHLRVKGLDREKLRKLEMNSLQRCMDYRLEVVQKGQGEGLISDATVVAEALGLDPLIVERAKELLESSTIVEKRGCTNA